MVENIQIETCQHRLHGAAQTCKTWIQFKTLQSDRSDQRLGKGKQVMQVKAGIKKHMLAYQHANIHTYVANKYHRETC